MDGTVRQREALPTYVCMMGSPLYVHNDFCYPYHVTTGAENICTLSM